MAKAAKHTGTEPSTVRIGDRRIEPGEVVSEPAELVAYLLERHEFITVDLTEIYEGVAPDDKED